ncbi:MAG TPA: DUF2865 domain-containing protein, partial [Hyphomicrobiaceae bacterium]|nr:DUF2865 domain-containing protein [Hyphomicrobiaceae bacterium]
APPPANYRPPAAPSAPNPWLPRREDDDDRRSSRSGAYRTVCVRLCDGFYWPLSYATSRSNFWKDASRCRASCGEDAQLFYLPNTAEPAEMVDLTGRAYTKLPTAFKYRKTLVENCKCKPEPWAASEAARHKAYADAAEAEESRKRIATGHPGDASGDPDTPAPTAAASTVDPKPADPPTSPWGVPTTTPAPAAKRPPRPRDIAAAPRRTSPVATPGSPPGAPTWPGSSMGLGSKGMLWPGDSR